MKVKLYDSILEKYFDCYLLKKQDRYELTKFGLDWCFTHWIDDYMIVGLINKGGR